MAAERVNALVSKWSTGANLNLAGDQEEKVGDAFVLDNDVILFSVFCSLKLC